tara:strand:+ start:192 stop:1136 length:945 start_codon:yes stop_codon:yes gene_type:complete
MTIDKKINYVNQDGYKNYIKNSDSVTVPKEFKSREDATPTKLAYITKDEAKMLKKMKKGTPHKGPSGIPSYDDYDASTGGYGTATAGSQMSGFETGNPNESSRADARSLGLSPKDVQDIRSGVIASGAGQRVNPGFFDSRNVVSRLELERARAFNKAAFDANRRSGLLGFLSGGGIFGNLMRGLGQALGLGKRFNEPTYDMRNPMAKFNKLGLYTDRFPTDEDDEDKPFGDKLQDTSFTKNDPNVIDTNELSKALIAAQNFSIPSGRFDDDPTINTDNVMGASQNMIGPNEMADYYNSQQFMDGGIVDLVDIYD